MKQDGIKDKPVETRRRSYDLVSSALRDGQVLRLQRPDLGRVDFTYRMEPEWENRHALLYDGIGKLSYLGTGADMWVSMCSIHLDITKKLQESIRCGRRALEVDPNHAWADLFLGVALAKAGIKVDAQLHLERAVERAPTAAARDEAARALSGLGGEP